MLILLLNTLASAHQNLDSDPQPSTTNQVEAPEAQNPTLAEFKVENTSLLSKMCKLIPIGSMTSNLPAIPLL